jgi:hypothetical protein
MVGRPTNHLAPITFNGPFSYYRLSGLVDVMDITRRLTQYMINRPLEGLLAISDLNTEVNTVIIKCFQFVVTCYSLKSEINL